MKALSLVKGGLKDNEIEKLAELGYKDIDEPLLEIKREERLKDYPTLIKYLQDHKHDYDAVIIPFDPTALFYVLKYRACKTLIMIRRQGTFIRRGKTVGELHVVNVRTGKIKTYEL